MKYILCKNGNYLTQNESGFSVSTSVGLAAAWNNPDKAYRVLKNVNNNKIFKKYHFEVRMYNPDVPVLDSSIIEETDGKKVDDSSIKSVMEKPLKTKRKVFTQEERAEIYRKTKGYCYLCGDFVDYNNFEVEHKIPLSKGGTNEIDNLFCSCHVCNSIKQDIYPEDFMERITKIFLYQMDQKHGKKMVWKMMSKKIEKMLG